MSGGINPSDLRRAFGRYMTGVSVVTALTADRTPVGFTANSFSSVSLDPPLLLVCPGRHLASYPIFEQTGHFAVSILAEGQEVTANTFATGTGDRFAGISWQPDQNGNPLIAGRVAGFSCAVENRMIAGDHMIMVGRVTGFDQDEASGLGFYNAGYFSLQQERLADAAASRELRTRASIILEADGTIMAGPDGGLPGVMLDGRDGARTALTAHLSRLGIAARLGPVFAIYDTPNDGSRHIVLRGQLMAPAKTTTSGMVAIDDIGAVAFADEALGDMLVRFADEFRNQSFGLYIGSADAGEVHTLNEE